MDAPACPEAAAPQQRLSLSASWGCNTQRFCVFFPLDPCGSVQGNRIVPSCLAAVLGVVVLGLRWAPGAAAPWVSQVGLHCLGSAHPCVSPGAAQSLQQDTLLPFVSFPLLFPS